MTESSPPRISVAAPSLDGREREYVLECMDTTWISSVGRFISEFETAFAAYCGVKHAIACNNGTTALHLALVALGVGPGDEVIVPSLTYIASANAVTYCGASPVLVDNDPRTFNLDPAKLEALITSRTKAIMPVHLYGQICDMDPILDVARRHGLKVVEDAAEAVGATYKGKKSGALGDCATFSFFGNKIITTGEGGMITTSDAALAERISVLRSHGSVRGSHFMSFIEAGYNYRLSDVNAAIGLVQMTRLDDLLASRRERADRYAALFADVDGVTAPITPEGRTHTYQSYVVLLDEDIDRNAVIDAMRAAGVETTLGTYSMHLQPYFTERFGVPDSALPQATRAHHSALTLPLYPQMDDADLVFVRDTLRDVVRDARRSA